MSYYKVVLVDDEEDVRTSIERKVDWESLGFELVGSASNGEEALELVEQVPVDVVMTDIKMPFMDGLELSAKVKENYKNTKVVLYSGFDDFEFAREAIHLEVEEYLLKPIGAKDLENVFSRIKENLDREFDERRNLENLSKYYQQSLPMMREHLLAGILDGKIPEMQAEALLQSYGMEFQSPFYSVGVLTGEGHAAGGTDVEYAEYTTESKMSEKGTELPGDAIRIRQMLMLSLMNLTKDYLDKNLKSYVFMYLGQVVVIALLHEEKDVHDFVYHMNQVCKMGSHMLDMHVCAGVGNAYPQINQIAISYEGACNAFDYRIFGDEGGHAFYINDVEPESREITWQEPLGIANVIHEIKFGTEEEVNHSIEAFVHGLKGENSTTIQQYQLSLMEMVTELLKLMRSYQMDMAEVFGKDFDLYQKVGAFGSLSELEDWLKDKCSRICDMIRRMRTNTTNVMTDKAKAYIEEHYGESDLSVEQLCSYLNVSATYFSVMFKKKVGMSFVAYLTKVRLDHALELLNNTEDKSYIIAEKVGYPEANYFSYVFKKKYGISPSKYRMNKES